MRTLLLLSAVLALATVGCGKARLYGAGQDVVRPGKGLRRHPRRRLRELRHQLVHPADTGGLHRAGRRERVRLCRG